MTRHPATISKKEIARLIGDRPNPVVLEIGCNDGTDSREIFDAIPGVCLHCFEPDPRPIQRFAQWASQMPIADAQHRTLCLHRCAVGDIVGSTTLHMSGGTTSGAHLKDWDLSSSIRKPTGHLKMSPWCNFDRAMEVPIITLDTWLDRYKYELIDFIWSDVQGAGDAVIRGGEQTLRRTRYLYQEAYETPMYEGELNAQQQMELLGSAWELLGIYEGCNFLARNTKLT